VANIGDRPQLPLSNTDCSIRKRGLSPIKSFSLVALVDDLVQRDLRRWGGGRESSFVYHYAKRAALPLVVITWVVYLSLPFSLHPTFIVLPFAALFALTVAVTASMFKKYL
jgi:integrating conjugative element membrane protein (TIGR03747 family)